MTTAVKASAKIASAQGTDIKPEWVVQGVPTTLQNK